MVYFSNSDYVLTNDRRASQGLDTPYKKPFISIGPEGSAVNSQG